MNMTDKMISVIAERHGVSEELMGDFLSVTFMMSRVTSSVGITATGEQVKQHDAFLAKLSALEMKARRYDLLIDKEKKNSEELAGK